MEKKFVSWRRVSTQHQGQSGLGLAAQQDIIDYFVKSEKGMLVADYHEVYTGKDLEGCGELRKAMKRAKEEDAVLIIAKSDRFRNTVEALQIYDEMGDGRIYFCDLPRTDKFTLTLFFALAEREAKLVSIRTKAALAEKKKQGFKLGRPKGCDTSKAVEISARHKKDTARAKQENKIIWTILADYVKANGGKFPTSEQYADASRKLNIMGVRTSTGLEMTPSRCRSCFHTLRNFMTEGKEADND